MVVIVFFHACAYCDSKQSRKDKLKYFECWIIGRFFFIWSNPIHLIYVQVSEKQQTT